MEVKVSKKKIWIELDTGEEAFITFGIDEDRKVIVVSTTYVPKSQRGKGIAGKLSEELVKFAKNSGYKIYPLCSYTEKFLKRKYPELMT